MISVKMTMTGFDTCAKKLRMLAKADLHMEEYIQRVTKAIEDMAYEFASVNTGAMREQITSTTEKTPTGYKGTITAGGGLIYVEYGTGPKALMSPANGLPKNPTDIPHTSKSKWFIPKSQLSAQQIADLSGKYHFPAVEIDGAEFFVCRGQPPRPFMYPAIIYEEEIIREQLPEYIRIELSRIKF